MALAGLLAAAFLGIFAMSASNASAAQIDIPNNGQVISGTPAELEGTAYYPVPLGLYGISVDVYIYMQDDTKAAVDTDQLFLTNEWSIDFGDMSRFADDGVTPIAPGTPLADGTYKIKALQISDTEPAAVWNSTFTIDSVTPDTVIDSATPASPASTGVRSFTFHSEESTPGTPVTFECRIDGGAWFTTDCDGSYTTASLPDGNHTFDVRARDGVNTDPSPASSSWVVDTNAPDTFIDSATPASPANVGVRTLTFHGEDPAPGTALTLECRIDGGAWFTAGCDGDYSTPVLADGPHTFYVRARDAAGNADASPATSSWIVDTTPPNTFIDTATPASPTNNQVRNFTYHGVDPAPGTAITLECRLDGGAWFSAGCNGTYNTGVLPEGNHTFEVRATDAAGNVDPTPASSTWMIDLTKPDISITTPAVRARYTLGQNVPPVFNCTDPLHGGPPAVASGIQSCTSNGIHTGHLGNFHFTVTARDHAGNQSEKTTVYAVDPPKYNDLIDPHHPIAYYRLGDPLGATTMADSSGNHRDGEYKNEINLRRPPAVACHVRPHAPYTCDLNADPQDWSATFPARDGYGFTNNIAAPKTAYTWEAWINRSDSNAGSIAGQGGAGQLFVNSEGKLALRQTQDTVTSSGPVLTPGQWFHVAATWNGSVTRLYVNGVQVGFSNSANKPPSGYSTLYVGYGDQAPWFHGSIDEVAYYGSALSGGSFATRYEVGTAHDVPSPTSPPAPASASLLDLAIQRPSADIGHPNNGGLYAPTKVPVLHFHCEDLDGDATVVSCTATVDGNPALDGSALPDTPGLHTVVATAVDNTGLTRSHTHTYTVKGFEDIYNTDAPLVYYRLGDANGAPMKDSGPNHIDGIYKNSQESGGIGISGDGDRARRFFGSSGYGYAQNIQAPRFQSTIEVWVNPDDHREQSIVGHGDAGEIYIGTDGTLNFRHMGVTVTAPGIPTGVFTQVVGVWDGTSIFLYVNGEVAGQAEATRRPSSSSTFYVGYGEIRPWFKGSLDEVAYYAKALTPNRILEHFLADPPPPLETFGDEPVVSPPDPGDPGDPGTEPGDPGTEPGPGTGTGDDPGTDPGTGDPVTDDPRIQESGSPKATGNKKLKGGKAAISKCKKIKNKKKRASCLKKARK